MTDFVLGVDLDAVCADYTTAFRAGSIAASTGKPACLRPAIQLRRCSTVVSVSDQIEKVSRTA